MTRVIIQTTHNQIVIIKNLSVAETHAVIREKLRNATFIVILADDSVRTFFIKVDEIVSIDIHNV